MEIAEAIKTLSGRRTEIPDCSRDDLPGFFKSMGYTVGAEIGVYKGVYTEKLLESGLTIYAIDPFLKYRDYHSGRSDYQERSNELYSRLRKRLDPHKNCIIVRKTSMEAVKDFEDESLDFVYIDGNHQLKYVVEDIFEWSFKVKKGGVISGHDYFLTDAKHCLAICHVRQAVDAYTSAYQINNWYVLGRRKYIDGEKRDRWRSWMWIKE